MNQDAIAAMKGKTVSSQYAVAKFIEDKRKNLPSNFKRLPPVQLKKIMASEKFVKVKALYKLPPSRSQPATAPVKKKPFPASKAAASAAATLEVKANCIRGVTVGGHRELDRNLRLGLWFEMVV